MPDGTKVSPDFIRGSGDRLHKMGDRALATYLCCSLLLKGILTMRGGGIRHLVIPPHLGYGASGIGPIPPNSVLLFECELISVGPAPAEDKSFWETLKDYARTFR